MEHGRRGVHVVAGEVDGGGIASSSHQFAFGGFQNQARGSSCGLQGSQSRSHRLCVPSKDNISEVGKAQLEGALGSLTKSRLESCGKQQGPKWVALLNALAGPKAVWAKSQN